MIGFRRREIEVREDAGVEVVCAEVLNGVVNDESPVDISSSDDTAVSQGRKFS